MPKAFLCLASLALLAAVGESNAQVPEPDDRTSSIAEHSLVASRLGLLEAWTEAMSPMRTGRACRLASSTTRS
jgi:hypothetical protein